MSVPESSAPQILDMEGDAALFQGKLQGLVATCYQNERPLQGLAGLLDWRLHGAISSALRRGALSGAAGECVYLPITRGDRLFHVLLLGMGHSGSSGLRTLPEEEMVAPLRRNLISLKVEGIGFSRRDFGGANDTFFNKAFKGVGFWIVQ